MAKEEINIVDEGGDKKYFTIIPNYIINHSTANDQALYLQMRRLTGDKEDLCFASEKYFKDKLGIGSKALKSSFGYLLSKGWIEYAGYRVVETKGGPQKIKTYLVKDIWKMNMEHYQGVSKREPLTSKGVSESNQRGVQKESKGVAFEQQRRTREEEPIKNNIASKLAWGRYTYILKLFKEVNPTIQERLKSNKTQLAAVDRMSKNYGAEFLEKIIQELPNINSRPYWKKSFTPLELETNIPHYKAEWDKEKKKVETNKTKVAIIT